MDMILKAFEHSNYTLADFFTDLLTSLAYQTHPLVQGLAEDLNILISSTSTSSVTCQWVLSFAENVYSSQMGSLSHKSGGFHFNAKRVREECIQELFTWQSLGKLQRLVRSEVARIMKFLVSCKLMRLASTHPDHLQKCDGAT